MTIDRIAHYLDATEVKLLKCIFISVNYVLFECTNIFDLAIWLKSII